MGILYLNVELPLYEEKTGKAYPVMRFSDWGMAIPGLGARSLAIAPDERVGHWPCAS